MVDTTARRNDVPATVRGAQLSLRVAGSGQAVVPSPRRERKRQACQQRIGVAARAWARWLSGSRSTHFRATEASTASAARHASSQKYWPMDAGWTGGLPPHRRSCTGPPPGLGPLFAVQARKAGRGAERRFCLGIRDFAEAPCPALAAVGEAFGGADAEGSDDVVIAVADGQGWQRRVLRVPSMPAYRLHRMRGRGRRHRGRHGIM